MLVLILIGLVILLVVSFHCFIFWAIWTDKKGSFGGKVYGSAMIFGSLIFIGILFSVLTY